MASIERSIEDMIEEAEDTEAIEEVAPPKAKRPRSQKQIESLAKAREARAKNIVAKKQTTSVEKRAPIVTKPKKQRKIVFENPEESSDEEVIVIKNPKRKKKKPKVVYQQESSSEEEEEYTKMDYHQPTYRFL
jgi:hypothetical protein